MAETIIHLPSYALSIALLRIVILSVGNFIDALSTLVVFYSCTYNVYHIDVFPDAIDVELGIGAVATENPYGLQAE